MLHNNGLEAKNEDLKRNKILRPKQPINEFIQNSLDIVTMMSIDDKEQRLFCYPKDLITPSEKLDGWQWLQRNSRKSSIIEANSVFYTLSEKVTADLHVKAKELCGAKKSSFQDIVQFDHWKKLKTEVFQLHKHATHVTCSCPIGLSKRFCKHSVGLMIKLKMLNVPLELIEMPLTQRLKRGRPKKSKGGLYRD